MGLEDPMGSAKPFESIDFGHKTGISKNWAGQGMSQEKVHKTNLFILRALCLLKQKNVSCVLSILTFLSHYDTICVELKLK